MIYSRWIALMSAAFKTAAGLNRAGHRVGLFLKRSVSGYTFFRIAVLSHVELDLTLYKIKR
jgi:hypothetical protein